MRQEYKISCKTKNMKGIHTMKIHIFNQGQEWTIL